MTGVFDGLRVLDLSWGIAGPMTTMLLADNGADVIRIERPQGDPFTDQSGYRVWNRGKRSAVLDLTSDEGHSTFAALVAQADVVVESFSPGTMQRLHLEHAELAKLNPRIITCSITAYGSHPGHRQRPGYDGLVAARTGLLFDLRGRRGTAMAYISRWPGPHPEFDGPEGLVRGADRSGPIFPRTPWPSIGATYLAALGIAAALRAREVTGDGQQVETSLLQGVLAAVCLDWQRVEHPDAPSYWMWPCDSRSIDGLYKCSDERWVHHWTVRPNWVLSSAEEDELGNVVPDSQYRDDPDRLAMDPEGLLTGIFLQPLLAQAFKRFRSTDWVKAGSEAWMGVAPVRSPGEALADESFLADGCVVEVEDPRIGRVRHVGPVLEFSATPGEVRGPTPRRGEHTEAVLEEVAADHRDNREPPRRSVRLAHPLQGVRVLDLGLGVAGPFAGRILADLGAEVIKVNAVYDRYWNSTHMGLGTNRGKRSIAVDLKNDAGRAVLDRLIERADVFTTNWRPGAAARLGLDYDALSQRFPRLVYCNSRGYEKGPRSQLPGTDQTASALTGVEWEDGACDHGNPPLWSRFNMGDSGNALLSAIAITAALYHRDRTGEGQSVSTSIVNASLLHASYAWIHADGKPGDWKHIDADQYGLSPFYRLYGCANDSWIFIAALSSEVLNRLADALGEDRIVLDDPQKATTALEERFRQRPASDWIQSLDRAGVPAEVVDEEFCRHIFDDPEARSGGLIAETWAGGVGRFEDPGLLVNFSTTPCVVQSGPALCGGHTREVLLEHGYRDAEIDQLIAEGAILDVPVARL